MEGNHTVIYVTHEEFDEMAKLFKALDELDKQEAELEARCDAVEQQIDQLPDRIDYAFGALQTAMGEFFDRIRESQAQVLAALDEIERFNVPMVLRAAAFCAATVLVTLIMCAVATHFARS